MAAFVGFFADQPFVLLCFCNIRWEMTYKECMKGISSAVWTPTLKPVDGKQGKSDMWPQKKDFLCQSQEISLSLQVRDE